jgi:hypothetical protein
MILFQEVSNETLIEVRANLYELGIGESANPAIAVIEL